MKYCSALKRNEILTHVTTWNLENITLKGQILCGYHLHEVHRINSQKVP